VTQREGTGVSEIDTYEPKPMSVRARRVLIGLAVAVMVLAVVWEKMSDGKIQHHFTDTTALAQHCERNHYAAIPLPKSTSTRGMATVGEARAHYLLLSQVAYPDRIPEKGTVGVIWVEYTPFTDRYCRYAETWKYRLGEVSTSKLSPKDGRVDITINLDTGKVEVKEGVR
jgi:hypothetical protein